MTTARDRPPEEASEDTSFARGLRLLLTVADRGELRADELSTLLDTPISTIYRYLRTLAEFGFIDRDGAGYRLGPRLIIGQGANVTADELRRTSDPVLRLLADETGETAVVVRRVGLTAVCLHEVPSRHALRVSIAPDSALPLDRGALGKVLLAFAPPEILDEILAADDSLNERASEPPPTPDRLREELLEIVEQQGARSVGEVVPGAVFVAVPVLRDDGIVAAVGVLGPELRCGTAWQKRVDRVLPAAANAILDGLSPGVRG